MIRVSWKRTTDNIGGLHGVLGYRVFRTIGTDPEKIEVSGGIINRLLMTDTTRAYVQDTLSKNLDYKLVRYHISAFDMKYNESLVESLAYTQPDTKRPMPPRIMRTSLNTANKVQLDFVLSPSRMMETVTHDILRRESSTTAWSVVSTITAAQNITTFTDPNSLENKEYFYSIRAKDAANNYSCDSIPTLAHTVTTLPGYCYQAVFVKTPIITAKAALTTLTQAYDENSKSVTLTWTYGQTLVKGYEIYRGITASTASNTKAAYLDFVEEPLKKYIDLNVEYNTPYTYRVRAIFTNGSVSSWREVQVTNLKKSTLSSNKGSITFANTAATEVATVTSNVNWTVTKSDTWITTSVTTGVNNGSITIGATANTGTTTRQGTVTIASGTIVSTVISVVQHPSPSGTGITVKYYNFPDLASIQSRPPNVSKLETQINLSASGSPVSGVISDFSSIWEGFIEVPKTGLYTFYLQSDDGAYLYLDGKKIGTSTGNIEAASPAQNLTFGVRYPIKIEHWDGSAHAVIKLQWASNVGLAKSIVATPYLYPEYIPTTNQQDPLDGNCFVIRKPSNNYTLQTPGDYTVIEGPFTNKNNQKWKLVKDGTSYKIVSQLDALNKNMQVINNGSAIYDKVILGFDGSKSSEKWNLISQGNNQYKINRSGSSYNLGNDGSNGNLAPKLYSGGENFILETTTCPNYIAGITLDTDELSVDFKQQTKTVQLKSDVEWNVINYNDWINVTPLGGAQNATVNVSVVRNATATSRSASVGFRNANGTSYITVNQGPLPCIELTNVGTDCGTKSVTAITINGSMINNGVYEFSVDGQNVWRDYTYQLSYLSNGPHVLHARKKADHSCTGSVNFEIYCY